MMKIPGKYASKFGHYDVTVHSTSVKVRVIDNSDVVSLGLSELKSMIGKNMVVGVMAREASEYCLSMKMLVLCVKSRCLIIQVCRLELIPQCLIDFLKDKEMCFIGPDMNKTLFRFREYQKQGYGKCFSCSSGMDVGDLAAKSLGDPTLLSDKRLFRKIAERMQDIANKVGVTLDKDTSDNASIDLAALAFSHDQIKCLVADVYASYLIAVKLLF